jgi:methylated-DNA-[protein]-cysteine S-methyltransferase
LDPLPLQLDYLSDFGRRVVIACRQLGWGQTATYGELARRAGSPAASRAVGAVMARNRHPLIVPCHRVLAADGSLRGFSAADGLKMKQRLLDHEKWSVPPSQASDQGLALTHN